MEIKDHIDKKLTHSIHTSERRSIRSCPRRHAWAYRDMYYPKVTPGQLEFGVWFHRAMEIFYEPSVWGIDPESQKFLALKAFRDEADKALKNYRRLNGEPEVDVLNDYKERIQLGLNMFKHYAEIVSPAFDQNFVPVEVEVEFEVPILSPQGDAIWCKCDQCWKKFRAWCYKQNTYGSFRNTLGGSVRVTDNNATRYWSGLPVTYGGRLDMLAKDHLDRYFVVDWKTCARMLNEGTEEAFLELDDQISSYCWALSKIGIPIAGFIYVEIKKSYPQLPEELSRTYKGKKFSTNKQNMTTYSMFLEHVKEHDNQAWALGLYDEYLLWLQFDGPKFHQRHQIHKNDYEIDQIGRNIYLEALEMVERPKDYPTPGRFSCPTCLYRQPCLGKNQGEDYVYTLETLFEKKEKHYWEEREPTTD